VGERIDERLAEGFAGVFVKPEVIEADDTAWVERVFVDESQRLLDGANQWGIDRFLALGLSRDFRFLVGIREDLALRKTVAWTRVEEDRGRPVDDSGSVLAANGQTSRNQSVLWRVVPDTHGRLLDYRLDQRPNRVLIQQPANDIGQRGGLECRGHLNQVVSILGFLEAGG
jgi:hypothetical protein